MVVVLATPPFWLANVITFGLELIRACIRSDHRESSAPSANPPTRRGRTGDMTGPRHANLTCSCVTSWTDA